jgi:hypothetical protein
MFKWEFHASRHDGWKYWYGKTWYESTVVTWIASNSATSVCGCLQAMVASLSITAAGLIKLAISNISVVVMYLSMACSMSLESSWGSAYWSLCWFDWFCVWSIYFVLHCSDFGLILTLMREYFLNGVLRLARFNQFKWPKYTSCSVLESGIKKFYYHSSTSKVGSGTIHFDNHHWALRLRIEHGI